MVAPARVPFRLRRPLQKETSVAIYSLEPSSLLKTFDLEGKGFLSEDEALLMVADLWEAHEPDGTAQLNAMMAQMLDRVRASIALRSMSLVLTSPHWLAWCSLPQP